MPGATQPYLFLVKPVAIRTPQQTSSVKPNQASSDIVFVGKFFQQLSTSYQPRGVARIIEPGVHEAVGIRQKVPNVCVHDQAHIKYQGDRALRSEKTAGSRAVGP